MNELNNYDLLVELVADRQAELRREAKAAGLFRNPSSSPVRYLLLLVLGSAALLALLVTLGIVLA